ncbi:MAG: hypothetical protein ABIH63_01930 [archaeon]
MKDEFRKAKLIGIGLLVVTKETAKKVANELMRKGKINEKQADAFVSKIAAKVDKHRGRIEKEVRTEISKFIKEVEKKGKTKKRK